MNTHIVYGERRKIYYVQFGVGKFFYVKSYFVQLIFKGLIE